jgi:uncharacterized protein YacL (UPF0231 family)
VTEIERILTAELKAERKRNETLQDEMFKLLSEKRELKVKLEKLRKNSKKHSHENDFSFTDSEALLKAYPLRED